MSLIETQISGQKPTLTKFQDNYFKNMSLFLSKNILFLRKKKGLIQTDAATALGLTRSTYANYENNQTEPSFEILERFVRFFGTDAQDLLYTDLENVQVNKKADENFDEENVQGNVQGNVQVSRKNQLYDDFFTVSHHGTRESAISGDSEVEGIEAEKQHLNAVLDVFKPVAEYIASMASEITRLKAKIEELTKKPTE